MSDEPQPKHAIPDDRDSAYRAGTPPWDAGKPHGELIRVLDEYHLRPQTVLEVGCGTGADAIWMARRRFEVTAVDCSPIAIERARLRAEQQDALLRFVLDDAFEFALSAGQFDFVYDSGMYHAVRGKDLERYLDMLWRVTRPGSYYLCLAGAPGGKGDSPHLPERPGGCFAQMGTVPFSPVAPAEGGPPQIGEDEIRGELGRLFEFVHLRPTRLESANPNQSYAAWSCLMRRPTVAL